MEKPTGDDAFTWGFRIRSRLIFLLLHVVGPPQGSSASDPRLREKREYDRRRALHREWLRGQDQGA
ncbi:hypothetical protein NBM05_07525 [Rothia sp. AR01]|uniref:Uncharacterized protein n=1 Tax=Rothia santali TaxID=2949643 RepID=A0A9X2KI57_9MICC|nr:hypothetical protein [Rothia santali]MCP3425858.1 hypothetical protein [Rothia santali]